jgi:hypothetical protein
VTIRKIICILWLLTGMLVILASCQTKPTAVPSVPVLEKAIQVHLSLLANLDAPAYVKREGWVNYQPVGFGALVYPTDLLKSVGQVTLLCADMHTVKTLSGLDRNPCPLSSTNQVLIYDEMHFASGTRSPALSTLPYILYPRSTVILDSHPVLRWHSTGATNYTVEIQQGINVLWRQADVTGDMLVYPADAPALLSGKDYLLVVTDNFSSQSSTMDLNKGLGFQIASSSQAAEIEKQKAKLNSSGLDGTVQKLALALYYNQLQINGRGLWGESSQLLAEVVQSQPTAPAVYLRLGETLSKMKLWAEAQAVYETALAQAQALNDLESQAEALAALWRITGNQAQFDQAVSFYEQLGVKDKADEIKKELKP